MAMSTKRPRPLCGVPPLWGRSRSEVSLDILPTAIASFTIHYDPHREHDAEARKVLREYPTAGRTAKVPIKETGIATTGTSDAR
jgi:hypothetical protein